MAPPGPTGLEEYVDNVGQPVYYKYPSPMQVKWTTTYIRAGLMMKQKDFNDVLKYYHKQVRRKVEVEFRHMDPRHNNVNAKTYLGLLCGAISFSELNPRHKKLKDRNGWLEWVKQAHVALVHRVYQVHYGEKRRKYAPSKRM